MLVSIITPVLNNHSTVKDAIDSVLRQSHKDIEHVVIDGGSIDGTAEIVKSYGNKIHKFISEPDRGIYDAMNKGIGLASGEIIGILNSDDIYANYSVVENIANTMKSKQVDACYGDLVYVDRNNTDKVVRYWKSCEYKEGLFGKGWMPPHPTFFVKRWVYEKYGGFDLNLPIALDFEVMFRFVERLKIKTSYIPEILVKMRLGGFSNNSITNVVKQNIEIIKILKDSGVNISPSFFLNKISDRLGQFLPI